MHDSVPRRERLVAWTGLVATVLLILLIAAGVPAPLFPAERYEGQPEIVDADTVRLSGTMVRDRRESGQACLSAAGSSISAARRRRSRSPTGSADGP